LNRNAPFSGYFVAMPLRSFRAFAASSFCSAFSAATKSGSFRTTFLGLAVTVQNGATSVVALDWSSSSETYATGLAKFRAWALLIRKVAIPTTCPFSSTTGDPA